MHKIFQCESYDTTQSCLSQNAFYGNKHNPTCEMCFLSLCQFLDENVHFLIFWGATVQSPPFPPAPQLVRLCVYIYVCIYIYIYDSQIVHHNPCFNLFILHNNSGGFCCTWTSNSYLQCSTHHRNSILVQFFGWLFHALQTLANQWLSK